MNIEFTGRQMEVGDDLRQYTRGRLRKITRLLGETYEMHVILSAEKHRRLAEVTLKYRDNTLVGIEESGDSRVSLNGALAKLERLQLVTRHDDRYAAVPIDKALEVLDYAWDNYFKYNNEAQERAARAAR